MTRTAQDPPEAEYKQAVRLGIAGAGHELTPVTRERRRAFFAASFVLHMALVSRCWCPTCGTCIAAHVRGVTLPLLLPMHTGAQDDQLFTSVSPKRARRLPNENGARTSPGSRLRVCPCVLPVARVRRWRGEGIIS